MTVTTSAADLLTYATRAQVEGRYADEAAARQEIIDNLGPVQSKTTAGLATIATHTAAIAVANAKGHKKQDNS